MRRSAALLTAWACLAMLIWGCEQRPDVPLFDNPLDPAGPNGGDPFGVIAVALGNRVTVTWNRVDGPAVGGYRVLHSPDNDAFGSVGEVDASTFLYTHEDPVPNAVNWYKVVAVNDGGLASSVSAVVAAQATAPPRLLINDGAPQTASRYANLGISTSVGDTMKLADNPGFVGATVLPAVPGDTTLVVPWDLGPAAANDEVKAVFLLVKLASAWSDTASQDITVDFTPSFGIAGDPPTIGTQAVDLEITVTSGDSLMRFAASEGALAATPWVVADSVYADFTFPDAAGDLRIWGEFMSDFQFSHVATVDTRADDLSGASFTLADGASTTDNRTVMLVHDAVASEQRVAEIPDFVGVPWIGHADTTFFTLSATPGAKAVHVQYRNFWTRSATLRQDIVLVGDALDLGFTHPVDGDTLQGGIDLTVAGFAAPATGVTLDTLQVDLGDGWLDLSPTELWSTPWSVPVLTTQPDSAATLRVRAVTVADTLIHTINVTIVHPLVTITQPTAGQQVTGDETFTVRGTATAPTGGPPLEAVEVLLDGQWVPATGTDSWSVDWEVPAVAQDTPATVATRAFAGGATAYHQVDVMIVPAPPPRR